MEFSLGMKYKETKLICHKKYLATKWICHHYVLITFETNFVFLVRKILTIANEIFHWEKPSMIIFFSSRKTLGNKDFCQDTFGNNFRTMNMIRTLFIGKCFCRQNLNFQWQNILSLKIYSCNGLEWEL